jgi:hypothetical protein
VADIESETHRWNMRVAQISEIWLGATTLLAVLLALLYRRGTPGPIR